MVAERQDSSPFSARSRVRWLWWVVAILLIVASGIGVAWWRFTSLTVDEPTGYSPASKVTKYTGVAPPPQASRIRTGGFRQGMVFSHYVRFEAPPAVCVAYAKQVVPGKPLEPGRADYLDSVIQKDRPRFRDLGWFDLPRATRVLWANDGPMVFVDPERGVFYFFEGF